MPDPDDHEIPPIQEKLHGLLEKILAYQHSLPDGRAAELDELRREGVLAPADFEFLNSNSITYKPHRLSDYHALDMFHMPTADGGCIFTGPGGPPLIKRSAPMRAFQAIVESFLKLPRPQDELLLHIEFTEHDGMGVAPEMLMFNFQGIRWRERLPAVRAVAAQLGLSPFQDEMIQGSHTLTFGIRSNPVWTGSATTALLRRGCGFTDETEIIYSAGALDEG